MPSLGSSSGTGTQPNSAHASGVKCSASIVIISAMPLAPVNWLR
jgi:hypothetical protein